MKNLTLLEKIKLQSNHILRLSGLEPYKSVMLMWIFIIFFNVFFVGCQKKEIDRAKFEVNIDMKITSINGKTCLDDNEKFNQPQECNKILFETIGEQNKLYREINTCDLPSGGGCGCKSKIKIDNEWIYNHKVGDVIHFDYLLKSKFFEIKTN
jgi:hypothetical protein